MRTKVATAALTYHGHHQVFLQWMRARRSGPLPRSVVPLATSPTLPDRALAFRGYPLLGIVDEDVAPDDGRRGGRFSKSGLAVAWIRFLEGGETVARSTWAAIPIDLHLFVWLAVEGSNDAGSSGVSTDCDADDVAADLGL